MSGYAGKGATFSYDKQYLANITAATKANPVVITLDDVSDYTDGDTVYIEDVAGMTELNGNEYLIANGAGSTFELTDTGGTDIDGTGYGAYTSGGQIRIIGDAVIDFADIASLKDINISGMSRNTIDTTAMDSTGGYREFIGSLREAGEVTFSMNFTYAGYDAMKDAFEKEDLIYYRVVVQDNATDADKSAFKFQGLVTACPVGIPLDDVISADITIKISGSITFGTKGTV